MCPSLRNLVLTFVFAGSISIDSKLEAQTPKEITNSIGMKLVMIPNGTFTMGSPSDEEGRESNENQHQVTISKDYYIGVHEVTQGQFEKVMRTNPSRFQKEVVDHRDSSMHPVENVSWDDAVKFCERLSELPEEKSAKRVYRLPTEAEWEYACRAGSKTAFCFGESSESLEDFAWFGGVSGLETHPVGEKKPNAWGVYDMHGNVWEWCSDRHGDYPENPVTDPVGPKLGLLRQGRGGSWFDSAKTVRSAGRGGADPSSRGSVIGFRVALSPPSGVSK